MKHLLATTALAAAASLAVPMAAHADLILILNQINTAGYASGPYAEVDVHLNGANSATITFTADSHFTFGEMGLNVNASSFSAGAVSFTQASGDTSTPTYTATIGGQLDGFGNFALDEVANPAGFSASVTQASFTLTNNSGTWATETSVLTANNPQGHEAAIHVFDATSSPIGMSAYAADGGTTPPPPPPPVPEPASLVLFGTGLIGMAAFVRRRRR